MLRMYFLQQWYSLSDEGLEDAIYDSQAMREFIGIDLSREQVPDATTLLKFRRKLEDNKLTEVIFKEVAAHLSERGLLMREGTMMDATIIAAPPSTKNKDKARDPEMHQTKKGNQWHFGMKAHTGVDAESGLVHSVHATAANESDVAHTHELLHGRETRVHADAGYTGVDKREEIKQAQDQGSIRKDITWHVAAKRGKVQELSEGPLKELTVMVERKKAQIRARVEHPYPRYQEPLPLQEGEPLSRAGQERGPVVRAVRIGQPGVGKARTTGSETSGHWCVVRAQRAPRRGEFGFESD